MKAPFKYSGGKSREAKFISSLLPTFTGRVIEPFAGSCALSFYLEKPAVVGDIRKDVILTLRAIRDDTLYLELCKMLERLKLFDRVEMLKDEFYRCRDDLWTSEDDLERAYRFIVIRQLVFSGIDRSNLKTGKENAPFGWYPKFGCNISERHHDLMKSWDVERRGFDQTISLAGKDDFVFVDPPYLSRNSAYGQNAPELEMHIRLFESLSSSSAKFMIVHCEHEFYREMVKRKGLRVFSRDHMYSQNFMGRDNSAAKTQHLYITNYDPAIVVE